MRTKEIKAETYHIKQFAFQKGLYYKQKKMAGKDVDCVFLSEQEQHILCLLHDGEKVLGSQKRVNEFADFMDF